LMHPARLERQLPILPAARLSSRRLCRYVIDEHNQITSLLPIPAPSPPSSGLTSSPYIHPTVTAGRIVRANPYDPEFVRAEDHELWVRTYRSGKIVVMDEPLLFYRECSVVNWLKLRRSHQTDRRIMRIYGPNLIGVPGTAHLIASSAAKDLCHARRSGRS